MNCRKCGTPIKEGYDFCRKCATPVEEIGDIVLSKPEDMTKTNHLNKDKFKNIKINLINNKSKEENKNMPLENKDLINNNQNDRSGAERANLVSLIFIILSIIAFFAIVLIIMTNL